MKQEQERVEEKEETKKHNHEFYSNSLAFSSTLFQTGTQTFNNEIP